MTIPQMIGTMLIWFSFGFFLITYLDTPKKTFPRSHKIGLIHATMYLIAGIVLILVK